MKINKYINSLFAALVIACVAGCTPDSYSLGDPDLSSEDLVVGKAYTITHDEANPNIVYLKSLLPTSYQVMWDHPQGRAQASEVTLQIPFAGTYQARMGVETRGGIVYGPYSEFTIDGFCSEFVDDPLWTALTGGVGHSKKWVLDIDATATCRYFVGPLYFYGTADNWNSVTLGETVSGDSWSWGADWAGNGSWLFGDTGAMDYGSMTFSLENGATVTVDDKAHNRTLTGTFSMDATNHTMRLTDAEVLHDPGRDAIVSQWGNVTILALTENYMQLAVLRDSDPSEGNCLLSYNFISEDYKNYVDNNVVPETPDVKLAADWRDYIEPKTQKEVKYKLAEENQFDWADLYGANKGITYESAADGIEDLTLMLNSGTKAYSVTTPDGNTVSGTYTLSDNGVYTFSDGLPELALSTSGNMKFKLGDNNTLRILSYTVDDYSGAVTDLWLGSGDNDDQGNLFQYKAYHFCPVTAGSGDVKRYTANLYFNNSSWGWTHGTSGEANYQSENVYITGDGNYTFKFEGAESDPYLIYIDTKKILKDYPNCDMTVTGIRVDGKSIAFDDASIDRGTGDESTTFRRYILNPWKDPLDFPDYVTTFTCTNSIEVDLSVKMDTGAPVVVPSTGAKAHRSARRK